MLLVIDDIFDAVRTTISGFCFGSLDTVIESLLTYNVARVNKLAHDTPRCRLSLSELCRVSFIFRTFQCDFIISMMLCYIARCSGAAFELNLRIRDGAQAIFRLRFSCYNTYGVWSWQTRRTFHSNLRLKFLCVSTLPYPYWSNCNCVARNKPVLSDIALKDVIIRVGFVVQINYGRIIWRCHMFSSNP